MGSKKKKKIKFTPGFERREVLVDLADRERDPIDHARPVVPAGQGNLYESTLVDYPKLHAVTLDIDLPCHLVESSTPGHWHLYIDHAMTWDTYSHLLKALAAAGVINEGYCELSLKRGATHLRKPDVQKQPQDYPDS